TTFLSGTGPQTHTYTGPLLLDVVNLAQPRFNPPHQERQAPPRHHRHRQRWLPDRLARQPTYSARPVAPGLPPATRGAVEAGEASRSPVWQGHQVVEAVQRLTRRSMNMLAPA